MAQATMEPNCIARPQQRRLNGTFPAGVGLAALLALAGACLDDRMGPVEHPERAQPPVPGLVASNPLPAPTSISAGPASRSASAGDQGDSIAYVSVDAGTVPGGRLATVANAAMRLSVTIPVLDGGFDPVAIGAGVGDSLEVVVRDAGGAAILQAYLPVLATRRPVVVRTSPPPRKRDVPLNSVMLVVFSDPVAPASLTQTSIQLLQGTSVVPGTVGVLDATNLHAVFEPAEALVPVTDYRLVVTQAVADPDGDALEAPVTVDFTTGAAGEPVTQLAMEAAGDIYVIKSNGTGLTQLTTDPAYDASPTWSPDGSKIAFMSLRDGNGEIYVMNADGSSQERLTSDTAWDQSPAWSPDGSKIAFVSNRDGITAIYVMNPDGTGPVRLTDPGDGVTPDWSPDGRRIAFSSYREGHYEIYVMNADGTGLTPLTNNPSNPDSRLQIQAIGPDWSPDGTKIAFSQGICDRPYGCHYDVYVMNADGSGVTRLTAGPDHYSAGPRWSPDGRRIAFTAGYYDAWPSGYTLVSIVRADGTEPVDLTVWGYLGPVWRWENVSSPDSAPGGRLRVTTATTGADVDPDGYSVTVDGGSYHFVGANDVLTLSGLTAGDHSVMLQLLAPNCAVTGSNPRTVAVTLGDTADAPFAITCESTGSVQVTVATTGVDPDPDGFSVRIVGAGFDTPYDVATNGSVTVSRLVAGDYSVTLRGVAVNCEVTNANPVTVAVVSGSTAATAFAVACAPVAQLAMAYGWDIYVLKANGTGLTQLTTDPAYDASPTWSPDGSKIAFMSLRDGNGEIYVMNADGSSQERLTSDTAWDQSPAWSPDGSKIAFVSNRDGITAIYVMNPDGTGPVRLTDPGDGVTPDWSPDGRRIAFSSYREGHYEIYVMNADGTGLTPLTNNPSNPDSRLQIQAIGPDWSPDGTKIAFSQGICDRPYGCHYDVYVMNADGS